MKISLAQSAGFCFGVKRAIRIALDTVSQGRPVEMLGDIVHNEDVVRQIEAAGIRKVDHLSSGQGKILLVRAHGAAKKIAASARDLGYSIVDATCPMVKEIHTIVREMEIQGYRIIIIGDRDHEEVEGIRGQLCSEALVIDSVEHIPGEVMHSIKHAAVVVQSTQNLEKVLGIVEVLKRHINDLRFYNTICKATTTRQNEIKTMPLENDVMLIIGSRNSANTKRLYEISKSLNSRSYWIQSGDTIDPAWFKDAQTVGITAGASTPEETIRSVVAFLKTIRC